MKELFKEVSKEVSKEESKRKRKTRDALKCGLVGEIDAKEDMKNLYVDMDKDEEAIRIRRELDKFYNSKSESKGFLENLFNKKRVERKEEKERMKDKLEKMSEKDRTYSIEYSLMNMKHDVETHLEFDMQNEILDFVNNNTPLHLIHKYQLEVLHGIDHYNRFRTTLRSMISSRILMGKSIEKVIKILKDNIHSTFILVTLFERDKPVKKVNADFFFWDDFYQGLDEYPVVGFFWPVDNNQRFHQGIMSKFKVKKKESDERASDYITKSIFISDEIVLTCQCHKKHFC